MAALGFTWLADIESTFSTRIGRRVVQRLCIDADRQTVAFAWRFDGIKLSHSLGLQSWLRDGRHVWTQAGDPSRFEQPPSFIGLNLPGGTSPAQLLQAHRAQLEGQDARPLQDLAAVHAMSEQLRVDRREAARARGWASDPELRALLGDHYAMLGASVRAELDAQR